MQWGSAGRRAGGAPLASAAGIHGGGALASLPKVLRTRPANVSVAFAVLFGLVAFFVITPIVLLLINSFIVGPYGTAGQWGLENWTNALETPKVQMTLWNTLRIAVTQQAIALTVAICVAWLLARTDLPARGLIEIGIWTAFFLPPLTAIIAWIMVFDSFNGFANKLVELLPFVKHGPFDIYSFWGIVWVHLVTTAIPAKVMLLTPIFRNMDASFEEASRASGCGALETMRRIFIPLMTPAILVVALLGMIRALESFEIEFVLGYPANIQVYSTLIYRSVHDDPPLFGQATVLSVMILLIVLPFIFMQQSYSQRTSHATVTGRYRGDLVRLRRWKWPLCIVMLTVTGGMTLLPMCLVVLGTFMARYGRFDAANPWTLGNWTTMLGSDRFLASLTNTLHIGIGAALAAVVVFSVVAYLTLHVSRRWRNAMDVLIWLPATLPGIVLGLGYVWLFLGTPLLRPLYGTTWILILVVALSVMTVSTQIIKSNLTQLGEELEQASWSSGATRIYTFRRIVVPLIFPSLVVVGILAFANAVRVTSYVALLSTSSNLPLSILQLEYTSDGRLELASVVGVIVMSMTIGTALLSRWIGYRVGLRSHEQRY